MKNPFKRSLVVLGVGSLFHGALLAQTTAPGKVGTAPMEVVSPREHLDRTLVRLEARGEEKYSEQRLVVYHEMLDVLRTTPALVQTVPEILRDRGLGLETSNALIHGLEEIGSSEAQQSLATIQSDPAYRHMDRLRAVMGLGAVETPTEAAVASLWSLASKRSDPGSVDLSNTALLSLGAVGSRLGFSSERYLALSSSLVAGLRATSDPSLRAMTLKAIGNLHEPSLGSVVDEYLFDEFAPVRASAAHALGMLGDVSKRELLASMTQGEPRGAVRAAFAQALGKLPASEFSLRTINGLVLAEPDPHARAMMVRYLVEHFHGFEEARSTLLELTATDPSQEVRILASYCLRH